MPPTNSSILQSLNWRYATKLFDASKKISDEDLKTILESGRLSPSSYGVEPWKFIVVENKALRTAMRAASYDQPKVTDASCIIVIACRTDARTALATELAERTANAQKQTLADVEGLRKLVQGTIDAQTDANLDAWVKAQCYIPLGIMMECASLLGIDNAAMEGFNPVKIDEILGLTPQHLTSTTMLALGIRGNDPQLARPKVRRAFEDVVQIIK